MVCLDLVLILQSTHTINVEGLEATSIVGLIGREFLMAGFQADTSGVADPDNDHTARLALAALIFLFWESDANLRHRAGWWAIGVLHETSLLIIYHD
jgi:hypothetical protein